MHSKTKLTALGLAGTMVAFATACPPSDPAEEKPDEPSIVSFDADYDAITSGVDQFGDDVQGEVALSWETADAVQVQLYAGDVALPVDDCEPLGDDCTHGGTLIDAPTETTQYRLEVVNDDDAECDVDDGEVHNPELCASEAVDVEVVAPATIALGFDGNRFPRDEDFSVDYEVENSAQFELGITEDGAITDSCDVDGDGPCIRDDADAGELTLSGLDRSFTLSGWADNGAEDSLGDVQIGDVELELHPEGAPVVTSFTADPQHVEFGAETTLQWETEETERVELSSDFEGLLTTDLDDECTDVDADGEGSCTVEFADDHADDVNITFSLVAVSEDDEESSPSELTVVLGSAPVIDAFDANPVQLPEGGGDVDLSWETSNQPERIEIIDSHGDTILDTDDDTSTDNCHSSGSDCELDADSLTVDDVEENTQYTLTATSPLGSADATVNVTIEGAPIIESMTVDGDDVMDDPTIVDDGSAEFEWNTDETNETELDRGIADDGSCSGINWDAVSDFGGKTSGAFDLENLDDTEQCFRLTALGEADQSDTRQFLVARHPEVDSFDADPTEATRGDDIELSWETSFASEVTVDVSPGAAVSSDDLDECTDVDNDEGSCTVTIRSGAPLGDVEFDLEAIGFDDSISSPASTVVHVGEGPSISFFDSPNTANDGDDIDLSWQTTEADDLTIYDGDGELFTSDDQSEIDDGTFTVADIQETTTWTLEVTNDFGIDTTETTTFLGPAVDVFDVNSEDALDGEADVFTGDVDLDWTTSASQETTLERGLDAQGDPTGDCSQVDSWSILVDDGAPSDAYTDADITENQCYRLTAEDAAGQTSSVQVEVTEHPFVTDIATTPDMVDGEDPQTVNIDIDLVGVTGFDLSAVYYQEDPDGDDEVLGTDDDFCDESDASGDTLDGSVDTKSVSCDHDMPGEHFCDPLTGCSYDPPQGTDYIRYELDFADDEGDGDIDGSDAYGEDVDVDWN